MVKATIVELERFYNVSIATVDFSSIMIVTIYGRQMIEKTKRLMVLL